MAPRRVPSEPRYGPRTVRDPLGWFWMGFSGALPVAAERGQPFIHTYLDRRDVLQVCKTDSTSTGRTPCGCGSLLLEWSRP